MKAGVSASTVSNVLNGKKKMNAETEARVLKAVSELSYSLPARNRKTRRRSHGSIGVVISHLDTLYYVDMLSSIERVLRQAGCYPVLSVYYRDPEREEQEINNLLRMDIDGLILATHDAAKVLPQKTADIPVLKLYKSSDKDTPSIYVDEYRGGQLIGELFHRKGLLPSGFVGIRKVLGGRHARVDGWLSALESHGCRVDPESIIQTEINSFECGYRGTQELLARCPGLKSVFACNDVIGTGALRALLEAGFKVPGDIAIAGFDNTELAQMCFPALTTVDMQAAELGRRGAIRILNMIEGKDTEPMETVLTPCLVTREST